MATVNIVLEDTGDGGITMTHDLDDTTEDLTGAQQLASNVLSLLYRLADEASGE